LTIGAVISPVISKDANQTLQSRLAAEKERQ
jgi:hypothetical protein